MSMVSPSSINMRVFRQGVQNIIQALVANGQLVASWFFQETSGTIARVLNPELALGRNIVINGTFATDTIWAKGTGATIAGGVGVYTTVAAGSGFSQTIPITAGRTYRVTYTVTISSGSVRASVGNTGVGTTRTSSGTYVENIVASGNTTFGLLAVATLTGTIDDVLVEQVNIAASSTFPSPLNPPMNGSILNGVILGQDAGNFLGKAYQFAPTNDYVDVYSTDFNGAINPGEATIFFFAKVRAASVWTNGLPMVLIRFVVDASNLFIISKSATNNRIDTLYHAGGTIETLNVAFSDTDWFMLAITVSKANDRYRVYINGAQSGATQTGIGTFVGNLNSSNNTVIGGRALEAWDGYICYPTVVRYEMTAAEILALARAGGVA